MLIICLWPNDHLCTVWGSIIFVVSFNTISNKDICYAMSCGDSHLRFLNRKKKKPMKNLCTWSTMWLFTYSWRGSIKLYFLRMHFCLEFYIELCYIAVTIMNSLYDHNEFFIWPYWILYIPIYQSFLLGDFHHKQLFWKEHI